MHVRRISLSEWGDVLPDDAGVFYRESVLEVLEEYADGELKLFAGFKGESPVAFLPVFVRQYPLCRAAVSPPGLGIPYLGPVLATDSPKRRKREQVNESFTERVVADLNVSARNAVFRVICSPDYADPRPYYWERLELGPAFTYVIDVDQPLDVIRGRFSGSRRREIRRGEDLDVTVGVEGIDAARTVYERTAARYAEQDEQFPLSWRYVRDLLTTLEDQYRVYVARDAGGEFLCGITVVYSGDTAYFWQGGTRTTYGNVSVNSLVHWEIMADAASDGALDGVRRYDLMGANKERLSRYKAKFGADLVPYYVVESNGLGMKLAKGLYPIVG